MKNRYLLTVILLFLTASMSAQGRFLKPIKSQKQGSNLALSKYTVGLKLGCPWSFMPDSELDKVKYTGNFGYSVGLVAERYFSKISVGFEGLLCQKGTKMYYDMKYQPSYSGSDVFHREFSLGYNAVSIRVPVTYYLKGTFKDDKLIPYLFVAPQVDVPMGFNAAFKNKKFVIEKPTISSNITTYGNHYDELMETVDLQGNLNVSALAGAGLMARFATDASAIIVKFDVGANFGLRNLAEEGFIWKTNEQKKLVMKENSRVIRSHDLEAHVTLIIPIKKALKDACHYLQK